MSEKGVRKRLSDFFFGPSEIGLEELREAVGEDDAVVMTVQTLSCTYKPRAWIDRNSFFRSILVLTEKRVLILKNDSRASVLRDIELSRITSHRFSSGRKKGLRLEIKTVDAEDVIIFHRQYEKDFGELSEKFAGAMERAVELSARSGETFFCMHCGGKIPAESVFCSSCGKRVRA